MSPNIIWYGTVKVGICWFRIFVFLIYFRSSRCKPSHASLLDISNLGVSDEEEEEDKDDSRVFHRGMSCPPERASRERLLPRPSQSISRDTSPVTESKVGRDPPPIPGQNDLQFTESARVG